MLQYHSRQNHLTSVHKTISKLKLFKIKKIINSSMEKSISQSFKNLLYMEYICRLLFEWIAGLKLLKPELPFRCSYSVVRSLPSSCQQYVPVLMNHKYKVNMCSNCHAIAHSTHTRITIELNPTHVLNAYIWK